MANLSIERDTEILIDNQLANLGWNKDPHSKNRNVYQQRVKTEKQKRELNRKRPDYVLYPSNSKYPLAVIEAKKPGQNIKEAINQGKEYANKIGAPLVFATDGIFTKTFHCKSQKALKLNGEELDELVKESLALLFEKDNEVNTLDKKVVRSRSELISIFETVNNLLREEGLQQGLERFTEFSNILFLKVLSEIEEAKEENGLNSKINSAYRWNHFKDKTGQELLSYVNDTVLKWFSSEFHDASIFKKLKIKHPDNLKEIIDLLDELQLTDINADVKGDAFEYFLRSYSASNPSDLGEIFTPRHIVKTIVKLANPKIGEKVYDPFCGTGGMLIVAFKHIMNNMARTDEHIKKLKKSTLYGSELTRTASIAKMNMILAGDGHNNIVRQDSLANPVDDKFDVVITNYPFSQKTRYGDKYKIPDRNGDLICPQHCFRSLKEGGRLVMIAPDGFLTNRNSKSYNNVRRFLVENATLENTISLPRGSFEPYNRAKASILHFTNIKKKRNKDFYYFFKVKNDGYTLDKKREPIDGISDLDLILAERPFDEKDEDYLKSEGFNKIEIDDIEENDYVLNAAPYIDLPELYKANCEVIEIGDILERKANVKVGDENDIPILSMTMEHGLIDQDEKFNKRVASKDISNYKKVARNELVVGFPIDEGVLGFQRKYDYAAVSPAYKVWQLTDESLNVRFIELLIRSNAMRRIYKKLMQGSVDRRRSIPDDIFVKIKLPIPNNATQKKIVKYQEKINRNKKEIKNLESKIQQDISDLWE